MIHPTFRITRHDALDPRRGLAINRPHEIGDGLLLAFEEHIIPMFSGPCIIRRADADYAHNLLHRLMLGWIQERA